MKSGDKLYYYHENNPEYGVKELEIKEVEVTKMGSDEWISGVLSNWDISIEMNDEYGHYYSLYQPISDKEIYYHNIANNRCRNIVLSLNKKKIEDRCKKCCESRKDYLERTLKMVNEVLNSYKDMLIEGQISMEELL